MSATLTELTERAEQQFLDGLRDGQQAVLATVDAWVKPLEKRVPTGPKLALPKGVPTSQEVVADAFALTASVVDAQRTFALGLLDTVSPVLRKLTGHEKKSASAKAA